jgi:hypothetical protein
VLLVVLVYFELVWATHLNIVPFGLILSVLVLAVREAVAIAAGLAQLGRRCG